MTFPEILLTMVLAAYARPDAGDPASIARLRAVTDDLVAVGQSHAVFGGEAGAEATSVALFAVARHESGFWADVQDCSLCFPGSAWCDRGRSVTLFQLREGFFSWGHYTRRQLCTDNRRAAERAAVVLGRRVKGGTLAMFRAYAGCSTLRVCRASRELESGFRSALARVGISVMGTDADWRSGR